MGGSVGVTIRLNPDEEFRMVWGTSGPKILISPEFLDQSPTFIDHKRARWREEEFSHILAPVEYGLVVFDMVSKTLLNYQEFTGLTRMNFALCIWPRELDAAKAMARTGRIKGVGLTPTLKHRKLGIEKTEIVPLAEFGEDPDCAIDAAYAKYYAEHYSPMRMLSVDTEPDDGVVRMAPNELIFDLSPITVYEPKSSLDITADDWREAYRVITEVMNFDLTPNEKKVWAEWISRNK